MKVKPQPPPFIYLLEQITFVWKFSMPYSSAASDLKGQMTLEDFICTALTLEFSEPAPLQRQRQRSEE